MKISSEAGPDYQILCLSQKKKNVGILYVVWSDPEGLTLYGFNGVPRILSRLQFHLEDQVPACRNWFQMMIWTFQKRAYPQIVHLNRIFHSKPSKPYIIPIYENLHILRDVLICMLHAAAMWSCDQTLSSLFGSLDALESRHGTMRHGSKSSIFSVENQTCWL